MRFDLFHEFAVPAHAGRSEAAVYADTLAEIALGDSLGYGCAWLVEHHFMRGYSHSSKPEILLGAAAARTTRIRLGHAIIPLPLHHPLHVAERVATLDVLSAGRLEVGIGRGFSPPEYAAFGAAMADSRALVDESLAILRASFRDGPLTHRGARYTLQDLDIVPRVVQRPHPPLWTAAVSPETFDWAAAQQLGVLAGPFKPWFMVEQDIKRYREAWTQAHEAGHILLDQPFHPDNVGRDRPWLLMDADNSAGICSCRNRLSSVAFGGTTASVVVPSGPSRTSARTAGAVFGAD